MKAISTVLAVILVVIIVVALVGLTYSFSIALFGVTTEAGEKATEKIATGLMSQARVEFMSINDITIRNIGLTDLSNFTVLINGEQADFTVDTDVIEPETLGTIKILDFIKEDDEITIISSEGATITKKAPDPCDQAVLCLEMDEGSGDTARDSAGFTGNDGTFYGENFNNGIIYGAQHVNGKFGKALKFDGLDDNVTIPHSDSLNTSNAITVESWFKIKEKGPNVDIVNKQYFLRVSQMYNLFYWLIYIDPSYNYKQCTFSLSDLDLDKWYHIAGTFNGTMLKLYLNGELKDSEPYTGTIYIRNKPIVIGKDFNGTIDEVRIFNRSLTQEEIQAEMQSSIPITRPVASYSFEESGGYANDTHIWVKGKYGKALSFDGVDDYVNISSSPSLNITNEITIELLVYNIRGPIGYDGIISKGNYRKAYSVIYKFQWMPEGPPYATHLRFDLENITGETVSLQAYEGSRSGWMHYVFTYDGIKMKAYVNGIKTKEANHTGLIRTNDQPLEIGRIYFPSTAPNLRYINGTIDEVRIYNKAIY